METFSIYKNLASLNELSEQAAIDELHACSGSDVWARRMAASRPFRMVEDLYEAGERFWFSLPTAEKIAAYASFEPEFVSEEMSEQTGLYKDKFGFIFVIFAVGRSSEEMLAMCRARIGNSVETELQIAAEEHWKILESRLNKLLEK